MQFARLNEDLTQILEVNTLDKLYPNTSFPVTGPDEGFLASNNLRPVLNFHTYNPDTQRLAAAQPYIEDGKVYAVVVEEIPPGELYAIAQAKQGALVDAFTNAAQQYLDNFANSRGYDNIVSAASYVASTIPRYASEAQRCIVLRDQWWYTLDGILKQVLEGQRPIPESFDDLLPELPALTWED